MRAYRLYSSFLCTLVLVACTTSSPDSGDQQASSAAKSSAAAEAVSSSASSISMNPDEATIREFYRAIAAHEFEAAYDLYSVKKVGLSTFKGWYATVKTAEVSDIKETEPHMFTFTIKLTEESGEIGTYTVKMHVENGKLETKSSVKISSDSTSWKRYTDTRGIVSLELPIHWKRISEYDGSLHDFSEFGISTMSSYGDENNNVTIDYYAEGEVNRQGKDWMGFAEDSIAFPDYYQKESTEDGPHWKKHSFKGTSEYGHYVVVYEFNDAVLGFTIDKPDATTDRILKSVKILRP